MNEPTDNGNLFVFCDHIDAQHGGCVRGTGHNGEHVFAQPNIRILAPVVLARKNGQKGGWPKGKKRAVKRG